MLSPEGPEGDSCPEAGAPSTCGSAAVSLCPRLTTQTGKVFLWSYCLGTFVLIASSHSHSCLETFWCHWGALALPLCSPHHCVGFLFLALHPLPPPSPPSPPPHTTHLTQIISHTLNSSTTPLTLISHNSSHTHLAHILIHLILTHTHTLTHLISHTSHTHSHTPHLTHNSSHTTPLNFSNALISRGTLCIWRYFCVAGAAL